jgi:hypothetical protein
MHDLVEHRLELPADMGLNARIEWNPRPSARLSRVVTHELALILTPVRPLALWCPRKAMASGNLNSENARGEPFNARTGAQVPEIRLIVSYPPEP